MGHPMAAAAGLAVQETIRRDNLLANVVKRGDELERSLVERLGNHHHVGDIRGRGLFRGVELVADRATKQVFDRSAEHTSELQSLMRISYAVFCLKKKKNM